MLPRLLLLLFLLLLQFSSICKESCCIFSCTSNGNATNFYGHSGASGKNRDIRIYMCKRNRDLKSETLATRIGADKARARALFIERGSFIQSVLGDVEVLKSPSNVRSCSCICSWARASELLAMVLLVFCSTKVVQPVRRLWPVPKECGCKFIALFAFSSFSRFYVPSSDRQSTALTPLFRFLAF